MNKNIFSIILLLLGFSSWAQYSLTGKITDAKTQEPLGGVNILIAGTQTGTVSDFDGNFILKNISKPDVELIVSYQGYETKRIKIHFDQPVKHIKITLKETPFELNEVIVSTGLNKLQKDNVMKVSHRSTSAMQRRGTQNLMEGISQIPGVNTMSTGTGINKPVIRGLTGNRVLVYNQGVKRENYQFGAAHGMGIDESGIAAVEVIKGSASLLYGSDAMGGVLYLIPEKYAPAEKTQADMYAKYFSNTQGYHFTAGYKSGKKKWRYLVRGAYGQNGDYRIPGDKTVMNSAYSGQDFKMGIMNKQAKIESDLRYNYNTSRNGIPVKITTEAPAFEPVGKYQDITTHNLSLKNKIKFSHSSLQLHTGYSNVNRSLVNQDKRLIDMRLQTISNDAKYYFSLGEKMENIIGSQVEFQTNKNAGLRRLLPDAGVFNAGIFTNMNYAWNKNVLQAGVRYDYRHIQTEKINEARPAIDKHLSSFSGALGVKTEVIENMNLRLNIASGFRAPNLAELTSNGEHESRIEVGNPALKNEQNIQTDLNWDFHSTHIEFFVNGFYNHIDNYIYLAPLQQMQNNLSVYAYRQTDAYLYGGEAGLHFHPHPWDWLHVSSSFETVTGQKQTGEYLPLIPADRWNNEIRLTNKHHHKALQRYYWTFQINKTFVARVNPVEEDYPGYTLYNMSLGSEWKFKKMKMQLNFSVHNLTDEEYISYLSVLREKKIPNQGRNFIIGLKFKY